MSEHDKIYLGDGVYAAWDGSVVRLSIGTENKNTIHLDSEVLQRLITVACQWMVLSTGDQTVSAQSDSHGKD